MQLSILLFTLFANLWIWRVFSFNFWIGILVVVCTFLLYRFCASTSEESSSLRSWPPSEVLFIFVFLLLLFFQYKTTNVRSLTILSNDDIRVRDMRLKEYPPVKVTLLGKTIWIPAAHWFEGRKESIAFFRILDNFSQTVDPNLYFFGNHPRERAGVSEFEKFPFVFFPAFIYGLFVMAKEKKKMCWLSLLLSLFLISIISNKNPIGPFSLFPVISVAIAFGIERLLKKVPKKHFKKVVIVGIVLTVLVLVQMRSYSSF